MSEKKDTCIIITGMHQSGTDVLAGCLSLMGVKTAGDCVSFDPGRDYVHPDLQDLTLIHDLLFQDLGAAWDRVGPLPPGWESSEAARTAHDHLRNLLTEHFRETSVFAVSDPRISRLMPLWKSLASRMNLDLHFILTVSRPWDVSTRLGRQNGLDRDKAHLLWLVHNQEAFLSSHEYPRSLVIQEQLLTNPVSILLGLSRELPLDGNLNIAGFRDKILAHVRPKLLEDMKQQDPDIPEAFNDYQWLYEQIRTLQPSRLTQLSGRSSDDKQTLPLPFDPLEGNIPVDSRQAGRLRGLANHVMSLMGRYEQAEHEREAMLRDALRQADAQGNSFISRVSIPADDPSHTRTADIQSLPLASGQWRMISAAVTDARILRQMGIALSPLNKPGMVYISSMALVHSVTGRPVWQVNEDTGFEGLDLEGPVIPLDHSLHGGGEAMRLLVAGGEATIKMPALPELQDCPLRFEAWIKADSDLTGFQEYWSRFSQVFESRQEQVSSLEEKLEKLKTAQAGKIASLEKEKSGLTRKIKDLTDSNAQQVKMLQESLEKQENLTREYSTEMNNLEDKLDSEEQKFKQTLSSLEKDKAAQSEKIAKLEKERSQALKNVDELRAQLDQKVGLLQKEKDQIQKKLDEASKENAARLSELEKLKTAQAGKIASLEKEKKELNALVSQLKAQNQKSVEELQNKLQKQEQLTAEYFAEMSKMDEQLASEEQKFKQTLSSLEKDKAAQSEKIAKLEKERSQALKNVDELRAQLDQQVGLLQKEKDQIQKKLDEASKENAARLSELEKLKTAQAGKIASLEKEKSGLTQKIKDLTSSNAQQVDLLKEKLNKQENLSTEYFKELRKLESQLIEEKGGTAQLQKARSRISSLEQDLVRKESELAGLKKEKETIQSKIDELKEKEKTGKTGFMARRALRRKEQNLHAAIAESGLFDPEYYLEQYPDVKNSGIDPLKHYMKHGWKEDRNPSAKFNSTRYLELNKDVASERMNPLEHYVLYGRHENRPL